MKIVFCGFGNPDNRGCEAIIRTTSAMAKKAFPDCETVAMSNDFGRTPMLDIPTVDHYEYSYYPHDDSFDKYIYAGLRRIFGSAYVWCSFRNQSAYRRIADSDMCISVGGDNFCYGKSIEHFLVHHDHFKRNGSKLVHWGTSFEENLLPERLIKDLNNFDAIMVRESISYDSLMKNGVTAPVYLIPDPAFTMEPISVDSVTGMEPDCVGLNVSPMIVSKESASGIVRKNTLNLINHITKSGKQVVLIPHVSSRKDGVGDYSVMNEILCEVDSPDRCLLAGYSYSAPQIKYIISKCSMFIGSRTHATIAAYSTCVPTAVIGYSVKAKGIAKDLFGTAENYVLPVQSLKDSGEFIRLYEFLNTNRADIKKTLCSIMPSYISKAASAVDILRGVNKGE